MREDVTLSRDEYLHLIASLRVARDDAEQSRKEMERMKGELGALFPLIAIPKVRVLRFEEPTDAPIMKRTAIDLVMRPLRLEMTRSLLEQESLADGLEFQIAMNHVRQAASVFTQELARAILKQYGAKDADKIAEALP